MGKKGKVLGVASLLVSTGLLNTSQAQTQQLFASRAHESLLNSSDFASREVNLKRVKNSTSNLSIGGQLFPLTDIWQVKASPKNRQLRVEWPYEAAPRRLVVASDVTFSDAQYIDGIEYASKGGKSIQYAIVDASKGLVMAVVPITIAPGGVYRALTHWFRADSLATTGSNNLNMVSWVDIVSGVSAAKIGTNAVPKLAEGNRTLLNFNPSLHFSATNQNLGNISVKMIDSLNYSLFTVTKNGMAGERYFNIGMNNTSMIGSNWDHPGLYASGDMARRTNAGGTPIFYGSSGEGRVIDTKQPSTAYVLCTNNSFAKSYNDKPFIASSYRNLGYNVGHITGGVIFGANGGNIVAGDDAGCIGYLGETIVYGHDTLTAVERNKVNSYLAIKYGITLDTSRNYTLSNNSVLWDARENKAFYNNVAGLARDNNSALFQKQSVSQRNGAQTPNQVAMGLDSLKATNQHNSQVIGNFSGLLWGDNGIITPMSTDVTTYNKIYFNDGVDSAHYMKRVWKVQNSGVIAHTHIKFPELGVGSTSFNNAVECASYAFISASDSNFTQNVVIKPLFTNGTDYELRYVFPAGASFFTFARASALESGAIYLPNDTLTTTEYYHNCNEDGWQNFHRPNDSLQKVLRVANLDSADLDSMTVKITPKGASYNNAWFMETRIMPRITQVVSTRSQLDTLAKVRIFYKQSEMDEAMVDSVNTSAWYFYKGDAAAIIKDIDSLGWLNPAFATEIEVSNSGLEDGYPFVEFDSLSEFGSFVFLISNQFRDYALPVEMSQFEVARMLDQVAVNWSVQSKGNLSTSTVQISEDGKSFEDFVTYTAQNGVDRGDVTEFGAMVPKGKRHQLYLRIKSVGLNGERTTSPIKHVSWQAINDAFVKLVPNPASTSFVVTAHKPISKVEMYNLDGKMTQVVHGHQDFDMTINTEQLSRGVYGVRVILADGTIQVTKVVLH